MLFLSLGRVSVLVVVSCLALTGCGSDSGQVRSTQSVGSTDAASSDPQSGVKLLKAGLGQDGQYAWVTSVVESTSDASVGKFVTVQFNVLDKSGEILASTDQVEAMSFQGQQLVLGTQVDLQSAKVKAAKVETTVVVGNDAGEAQGEFKVTATKARISKGEFGGVQATFQLVNAGSSPVKDARVGVVCLNKQGGVIGGTSEFPSVIPGSGRIRVDADVTTSGVPATCEVYPGPGL